MNQRTKEGTNNERINERLNESLIEQINEQAIKKKQIYEVENERMNEKMY